MHVDDPATGKNALAELGSTGSNLGKGKRPAMKLATKVLAAALPAAATLALGTGAASAAPAQPVKTVTPMFAKFYVNITPEDGYRTSHPFSSPIRPSGGLNGGWEYVYCWTTGDRVDNGGSQYNYKWLKTDLDWTYSGMSWQNQYVSAYGLTDYGNNEVPPGLPHC